MTADTRRVRIERRIWNAAAGAFVATGEVTEADTINGGRIALGKPHQAGRFLRGPVPWGWVIAAASLPGQALIVGLCLWRLAGAMGSRTVMLSNAELEPFGIDRAMKCRALAALERAGLITVAREAGRFPKVTLPLPAQSKRGHGRGRTMAKTIKP
jgi:hypothetical protein